MRSHPMTQTVAASLLLAIGTHLTTAAVAQSLSPAYIDININNTDVYTPGVYSAAGATGTVQALPSTLASFQTSYSQGSSKFSYFFSVNGPAGTYVPVDIQFNATTSATGPDTVGGVVVNFGAEAQLLVASQQNIPVFTLLPGSTNAGTYTNAFPGVPTNEVQLDALTCIAASGPCGDNTGLVMGTNMSGVLQVMLPTNLQNNIVMTISGNTDHLAGDFSSASLDPYIYVDPSAANAASYTIQTSSGVGNTPVPISSSWWLMLSGAVGLGTIARGDVASRRRNKRAASGSGTEE